MVRSKTVDIDERLAKQAQLKGLFSTVLPFLGLVLTILVLDIATKGLLLSSGNLRNIINQCFTTTIVGIGAAFIYARGGMDFSIGPACGVAQLVIIAMIQQGCAVWISCLMGILVAVACTMIVGVGADKLHLQPFVVSLCVRSACTGVLVLGCNALGRNIRVPIEPFAVFTNNGVKVIVLVAIVVVGYYLFEFTGLGKELKAVGGNPVTARQSGIGISKGVVISHLLLGLSVGIAACFQMARNGSVTAQTGSGLEFNIMIAMALGGFPMAGGSSSKIRSIIVGVLTITFLTNGLAIAGVDIDYINLIKGLLFIVIVAASYDRSNLKQVVLM